MNRLDLIGELCSAIGVSGFEDDVRNIIREKVTATADEVRVDALGNVMAVLNPGTDFTVMIEAHMDEIGFIVSHVEEQGLLRFSLLGGWDPRVLPAHQVVIQTRTGSQVKGAIGMAPPHVQTAEDQKKVIPPEGVSSAAEARDRGIGVGCPGALYCPVENIGSGCVMAKALDDRLGCALLIELLDHFAGNRPDFTLVATFAIGEEVGLRGATAAAYSVNPDLALVLEATVGDTPGLPDHKQPSRLGRGAAVTIADNRIIVPSHLVSFISQTAESLKIGYQYKTPIYGGTDAGAIHLARGGVPTAVISVPCRYIHSPSSLFRTEDYESVFRLALAFLQRARQAAAPPRLP